MQISIHHHPFISLLFFPPPTFTLLSPFSYLFIYLFIYRSNVICI